jgi:hypothetical protein
MGHFVTGLIAKRDPLVSFALKHALRGPIPLTQSFEMLPLRDEDIDSFLAPPLTGQPSGFNYLSEQLVQELTAASVDAPIMYFETEYFGGVGAQRAAVFAGGALVYGPASAESGPINEALTVLGVVVTPPAADAFDTVGLGQYRHTEDWLESLQ